MEDSCECGNELPGSISGGYFLTSGGSVSSRKAHAPELLRYVYVSNVFVFNECYPTSGGSSSADCSIR